MFKKILRTFVAEILKIFLKLFLKEHSASTQKLDVFIKKSLSIFGELHYPKLLVKAKFFQGLVFYAWGKSNTEIDEKHRGHSFAYNP